MNVKESIGECAGKIYFFLKDEGKPVELAEVLKKVNPDASLVMASLGWLMREDKIDAVIDGNILYLSLK
ncbi:MAG: winged helix-turn-helix domain-containing protein [Candidatus Altiarchaeota archaeon]